MNRCNLTSLFAIAVTAIGLNLLSSNALAQQKSLKDQLVGTWTLVSSEATASNGTKQQYFGANPRGVLILDSGGRYAQVWGQADRPKFKASGNLRLDTPAAEYGEAARAFVGNFGTWTQRGR